MELATHLDSRGGSRVPCGPIDLNKTLHLREQWIGQPIGNRQHTAALEQSARRVIKDQKLFLSLARRVPLIGESMPNKFSVCSSKGQALQLTHALDFLSIQPLRGVDGVSIEGEDEDSIAILAMSTEIISRLSRLIYGGASPDLRLRSSA